jgi:hypothetical protein
VPEGRLPAEYADALRESVEEALTAHLTTKGGVAAGGGVVANQVAALKRRLGIASLIRKVASAASE